MMFGQFVIGPTGSGKTTYCNGMSELLIAMGRKVSVINLDPGNSEQPYDAKIDVCDLITVEDVMENEKLGPNGGLIFCIEYLESNIDWLMSKLKELRDCYLIFDCPGQVELYTHHTSMQNIVAKLQKAGFRLSAVHLVDSHYCCDAAKFISVLLTSLATMAQMEMPHINVLSKADLIEEHGKLDFSLDFYTEVLDLETLVNLLSDDPIFSRYKKLNEAIVGLVESYSLVSFHVLSINVKDSVLRVLRAADKANGYGFGIAEENRNIQNLLSCAMGAELEDYKIADIREKYIATDADKVADFVSQGR